MHNKALRGPNGKVISRIRPDVQAYDHFNKKLYVVEVVDSSMPAANRGAFIRSMLAGSGYTLVYTVKPVK
jgi:hypothetical protein